MADLTPYSVADFDLFTKLMKQNSEKVMASYDDNPRRYRDVEKRGFKVFGDELKPPKRTRARNRYRTPVRTMDGSR